MTFDEYRRKYAPNEKRQEVIDLMSMTWAMAMMQNNLGCNNLTEEDDEQQN
jgi:hypothetical protein